MDNNPLCSVPIGGNLPCNAPIGRNPPCSARTGYSPPFSARTGCSSPCSSPTGYSSPCSAPTSYSSPCSAPTGYSSPCSAPTGYSSPCSAPTSYSSPCSAPTGYSSPCSAPTGYNPPCVVTGFSSLDQLGKLLIILKVELSWQQRTDLGLGAILQQRLATDSSPPGTHVKMKLQIFTVDAFTDQPFSGNPAAVIPLTQVVEEDMLQRLAEELNLSETAYVSPKGTTPAMTQEEDPWVRCSRFTLRWFTPTNEVPLCGHATLATAHVLFHSLGNLSSQLEFETLSGVLVARREGRHIVLDFPANPPMPLTALEETQLAGLLKVVTGHLQVKQLLLSHTTKKLLVSLHSCTREQLEALQLDTGAFLSLHDGSQVKGIIFTTRGKLPEASSSLVGKLPEASRSLGGQLDPSEYHCLSRYFAPWNGIPEDPVTGSAHTVLGPYWSKELGITTLRCRQCSPRGGDVRVTVRTDGRVDLAGLATTLIQGYVTL